ncbi:hypothetical protein M3J09_001811 [Ascochyta lentis]
MVHCLSPVIDMEPLELKIANHLEKRNLFPPDVASSGTIALILAVLASGAQYSDLDPAERRRISRDFASKSFRALHLANYLVRPTAPCLQTLLLLGSFIRNDGDANASWALLGTTMRLAQSVGLHDVVNMHGLPAKDRCMRLQLWKMVLQHDSILSLCFDRPTSLPALQLSTFVSSTTEDVLDYPQAMWGITQLCIDSLEFRNREIDFDRIHLLTTRIDSLSTRLSPHLQTRKACSSMQDRLEHYTLHLQMTFLVSVICRPVYLVQGQYNSRRYMDLNKKGRLALASTVRSFLSLHKLTIYAIRTWTTLHGALASALLLELLHEPDKRPEVRNMQREFLEVVIPALNEEPGDNSALSVPHIRAIAALREISQRKSRLDSSGLVDDDSEASPDHLLEAGELSAHPIASPPVIGDNALDSFDSILWGERCADIARTEHTDPSFAQIPDRPSMTSSGWA